VSGIRGQDSEGAWAAIMGFSRTEWNRPVIEWKTVQEKINRMLASEDGRNPLTDDQIVQRLEQEGLRIARRAIVKHRKKMGIPPPEQRHEAE